MTCQQKHSTHALHTMIIGWGPLVADWDQFSPTQWMVVGHEWWQSETSCYMSTQHNTHSSPPGPGIWAVGASCLEAPPMAASIFLVPDTISSIRNNRMAVWNGQCKLSVSSNKNTTNLSHFNQRHDGLIFKPPFGFCHCVFSMQLECSNCSILVANISK